MKSGEKVGKGLVTKTEDPPNLLKMAGGLRSIWRRRRDLNSWRVLPLTSLAVREWGLS